MTNISLRLTCAALLGSFTFALATPADAATSGSSAVDACAVFEAHANRGTLDQLIVPFSEIIPAALQEKQPTIALNAPAAKVNLTGDGRLVYAFTQGYMDRDRPDLVFIDTRGARVDVVPDAATDAQTGHLDIVDFKLLRIDGRIFILASSDNGPQYLTRVDEEHREVPACHITRKSSTAALVVSRNENLCAVALAGALDFAQFNASYSDVGREFHRNLPEVHARPGAARIDLDNDGTEDAVVRVTKRVKPMLSRGCSWGELAILNDKRDDIDRRRSNALPRGGCASERLPFVFEATTYVLSKDVPDGYHTFDEVTLLKGGRSESVCRIERRPVYDVEAAAATVPSSAAVTIR